VADQTECANSPGSPLEDQLGYQEIGNPEKKKSSLYIGVNNLEGSERPRTCSGRIALKGKGRLLLLEGKEDQKARHGIGES